MVPFLIVFVTGLLASDIVPVSELEKGHVTINKEVIENRVMITHEMYEDRMND